MVRERGAIWVICRSLPVHVAGGMERVTRDLVAGLARRGWDIDLITTRLPADPGLPGNVRVHAIDAPAGRHSRRFRRGIRAWAEQRRPRPALILSVSFAGAPAMSAQPKVPAIVQCHGSAWREAAARLRRLDPRGLYRLYLHVGAEREALRRADRIVAVGPAVQAYLTSFPYRFVDRRRVRIITNGIDTGMCERAAGADRDALRAGLAVPPGDRLIVAACRQIREKGVGDLLRGYELMDNRDQTTLLVAGEGRDLNMFRRFARARGLSKARFLGALPRARAIELLRAADLAVQLGTLPEGLPLVILEALSVGCPVLVSDRLVLPRFPEGGPAVLAVSPTSAAEIAVALARGLRIGAPLDDVGAAARREFSLDTMLDRYEQLLEETG